jgi:hypothetical protein
MSRGRLGTCGRGMFHLIKTAGVSAKELGRQEQKKCAKMEISRLVGVRLLLLLVLLLLVLLLLLLLLR